MTRETLTQEELKHIMHYDPETGELKWRASIGKSGKQVILGHFKEKEDAARARKKAEIELKYTKDHGESYSPYSKKLGGRCVL